MSDAALPLTEMPSPQYVMTVDGNRIATYSWGDPGAETVLCVHGFASSCRDNWVNTGWVRDLTRAGYRVLGVDQRGHGKSDKPHDPRGYTMSSLVSDLETVLDTHLLEEVRYAGYSLGARVGWQFAVEHPERVTNAVLGGIPDGRPLARLQIEQARAYVEHGTEVEDAVTRNYVTLAERVAGNDLAALISLAEGMRFGEGDPDPTRPPLQSVLFATGSQDAILERSRALAAVAPAGTFVEIPDRHHFNTPGSRVFRQVAIEFFQESRVADAAGSGDDVGSVAVSVAGSGAGSVAGSVDAGDAADDVVVSALAINVAIPESLRWRDERRGQEFELQTLNVRLLPDGTLAAKAYGRPVEGGRAGYVAFKVPDSREIRELIEAAAGRAGSLWTANRGLDDGAAASST